MAEGEAEGSRDDLDTPATSPDSTTAASNGLRAPKDRNCPFCGHAFTSSSLGRHLDLYIKPKNPKPPDGLHDVEEIKKLRGGITRRQPRISVKPSSHREDVRARNDSEWEPKAQPRNARSEPAQSPQQGKDGIVLHTYLNAANWQATGVINNLPPRASSRTSAASPQVQEPRARNATHERRPDYQNMPSEYNAEDVGKLHEAAEVGRAAEMALREVLGSLEAAKRKTEPPALFEDVEFFTLSFPGLCLAMLPPPAAIFSSTPVPVAHTWALSPPGEMQRSAMVRQLYEKLIAARNEDPESYPESYSFKYRVHLDSAYEQWLGLSEEDKARNWNLELCRAFVRERERNQGLERQLETAQQRIQHLETEYDRLSRCQLPRDYLLHPPNTVPISPSISKELSSRSLKSGASELNYDVDALLDKWKAEVKRTARPMRAPTQPQHMETTRNELKADMVLNGSVFNVNGPVARGSDEQAYMDQYLPPKQIRRCRPSGIVGPMDEVENITQQDEAMLDNQSNGGALVRLPYDGSLNANGKRPLDPGSTTRRRSGFKVYKEQPS